MRALDPLFAQIEKCLRGGNTVWVIGWPASVAEAQSPPPMYQAPLTPTGWLFDTYTGGWHIHHMHFLYGHALDSEDASVKLLQPASQYECPPLLGFRGWGEVVPMAR